jgi:hypothetical protein
VEIPGIEMIKYSNESNLSPLSVLSLEPMVLTLSSSALDGYLQNSRLQHVGGELSFLAISLVFQL